MKCGQKPKQNSGFSIVEVLVSSAILGTILVSIWSIFLFGFTQVAIARARTVATNIANEKMEIIRNMSYDSLGISGGHPEGPIPALETVTRNGVDFEVTTFIRYFDSGSDSFASGAVEGKHVHFEWAGCAWDYKNTQTITIEFYTAGVTYDVDFQDYLSGNQFNWSGVVVVGLDEQHFHLHTDDVKTCPVLSVQTQNVEYPFKLYVDDYLLATYTAPDTFSPAPGVSYEIIGQGGDVPADVYPNDYLQVDIQVKWLQYACPVPVTLSTFVAQRGLETAAGTGVINFEVLDAEGHGVPGATIHVENDNLGMTPFDEVTDNNGMRLVPVLDPDDEAYEITISKEGYSTDMTYDSSPQNPHPTQPHLTVEEESISEATFAIDLLSSMSIDVIKLDDTPAANVNVHIEGSKLIGTTPDVTKYTATDNETDANGHIDIADMEWDTYILTAELPSGDVEVEVDLAPDTAESITITPHTYELTVQAGGSGELLEAASVHLVRADIGYDETLLSDANGVVDFSSMQTGDYDMEIALPGYQTFTQTVTIATGENSETIELDPS